MPPKKRKWAQFEPSRQGARILVNQEPNPSKGPAIELFAEDEARLLGTPPEHWALVNGRIEKAEVIQPVPSPAPAPAIMNKWVSLALRILPYITSAALGAAITALLKLSN